MYCAEALPCVENLGMAVLGVCCVVYRNASHLRLQLAERLKIAVITVTAVFGVGFCVCVCAALLQGAFPFTSGSLRKGLWTSKYLLQHRLSYEPAIDPNRREHACTQGIKVNIWKYGCFQIVLCYGTEVQWITRYTKCITTFFPPRWEIHTNWAHRNVVLLTAAPQPRPQRSPSRCFLKPVCRWCAAGSQQALSLAALWGTVLPWPQHHQPAHCCILGCRQAWLHGQTQRLTRSSDSCSNPNGRCLGVWLPPCFFTNCSHLKAEKIPLHRT